MEEENKKAYSEVIEILKLIDEEEKLEKLPIEMLEVLKSKVDVEYHPKISKDIPLEDQNLQKETFNILAWISIKYLNEPINEVVNCYVHNENIEKEKSVDNMENTNEESLNNEKIERNIDAKNEDNKLPILHKELKWYEKLKIKIIEIFNKIFRINKYIEKEQ